METQGRAWHSGTVGSAVGEKVEPSLETGGVMMITTQGVVSESLFKIHIHALPVRKH